MVFDPAGEVLLIRYVVPREDGEFVFWITPGGEIEQGETEIAAARREVLEELGLTVEVEGPMYEEENEFAHQGEMRANRDFFFRAFCAREAPVLTGFTADEIAVMREIRWWSAEEIESSEDRIFPADLAAKVRALGRVMKLD
jgi:8-oxo-dGTP diphosphatase